MLLLAFVVLSCLLMGNHLWDSSNDGDCDRGRHFGILGYVRMRMYNRKTCHVHKI